MNVLYVTGGAKCQRVLAYTAFACFIGYWHQDIRADAFKIAQKTTQRGLTGLNAVYQYT